MSETTKCHIGSHSIVEILGRSFCLAYTAGLYLASKKKEKTYRRYTRVCTFLHIQCERNTLHVCTVLDIKREHTRMPCMDMCFFQTVNMVVIDNEARNAYDGLYITQERFRMAFQALTLK